MLLKLLKLFGYNIFENKKTEIISVVKKHSLKRAEERITNRYLLKIVADCALEYGDSSVYFDYKNHRKQEGVFAKKFKDYIFVFSKKKELITIYPVDNIVDILVKRK